MLLRDHYKNQPDTILHLLTHKIKIKQAWVNIMAQGLATPDPSLSLTHLSISRGRATTTHYTHHQVSLMVSH